MSILDLQNDSMMNQAEGSKNKQTPTKLSLKSKHVFFSELV